MEAGEADSGFFVERLRIGAEDVQPEDRELPRETAEIAVVRAVGGSREDGAEGAFAFVVEADVGAGGGVAVAVVLAELAGGAVAVGIDVVGAEGGQGAAHSRSAEGEADHVGPGAGRGARAPRGGAADLGE